MLRTVRSHGTGRRRGLWLASMVLIAAGLAACTTPQERVALKEDNLAAAGFVLQPANTPDRQAMLNRLPPHHFVRRVRGDVVSYVYADPLVCDCLYVGSQEAYGRYQAYLQQRRLIDDQETTAQLFSDPAWDWNAWGPWGPGFAWGPGPGW